MAYLPDNFALLDDADAAYATARAVVLPVPFERTVSYGRGTAGGPAAIVRASQAMELYDDELGSEPYTLGIHTLPPFHPDGFLMDEALGELEQEAHRHLAVGKFLVTLGGEHSLTIAPVRAARRAVTAASEDGGGELGVVQFDAHADLREEYGGTPYSHASVMRRVFEDGMPTLAVGIRSLSTPEAGLVGELSLPVIWGRELGAPDTGARFAVLLDTLPEHVYLTFDVDYFDPSLMPATGTPEPGGGHWWPTLTLLRDLFRRKTVVAMDVVELAPIGHLHGPEFMAAKLVYKCLGYLQEKEGADA